jgi:hypothetical protein
MASSGFAEKEISPGRVSWQTCRTYFEVGPLASSLVRHLKQLGQNVFLRFFTVAFFPNDLQTYMLRVRNLIDYYIHMVI